MSNSVNIWCRGLRGATTADDNSRDEILLQTRRLLALMIRLNNLEREDVCSAIFSITPDLNAEFPALAARQLGWLEVPLLCTHEVSVPDSLPRCIRILVHWNTAKSQDEVTHVYIRDAVSLRPDLCKLPPADWDELEAWIAEYTKHNE
jgi:chorismate mutase